MRESCRRHSLVSLVPALAGQGVTFLTGDAWFLEIARAVSTGAKCTRRQVGAIIVDSDNHVAGLGKNGSPPGDPECTDGACPRGRHWAREAAFGDIVCGSDNKPWPCPDRVEPGSGYDTGPGSCIANHAEANALLNRTAASVKGMTMYVTDWPCDGCMRLIRGAQIARIVTPVRAWQPGLS